MVLDQTSSSHKGFIAENFAAQQLRNIFDRNIYSWSKARSEIEFVLPYKNSVVPIEVKSGIRTRSKSLSEYKKKYSPDLSIKLSGKNIRQEKKHLNVPLYFAEFMLDSLDVTIK